MASTVWRGYITFGLVSVPVRLFRAARAERVNLRRLYRAPPEDRGALTAEPQALAPEPHEDEVDGEPTLASPQSNRLPSQEPPLPILEPELTPVQQASVRKGSDELLTERSVVKGFEYEKDRYVALEPEDLKSIAPKTATEMQIEEFVNLAEVDPVYFETSYYVMPEEVGQKAYALLYRSLQTAGLVAVARFAMHSREHVVIVRPGGQGLIAHTMFFSSEVRAADEYKADPSDVTPKELDLAQTLIHSLAAPFQPEKYRDTYREKLEALIAKRVAGQPVTTPEKPSRKAAIVDITEALQKSLAALKKPAASEQITRKGAKAAGTQRKKKAG
jgi:DNA end-binding protein Ku